MNYKIINQSAKDSILSDYDKDTLSTIATHGCVSGCASGFIYTHEILEFFNAHQDEIEETLEDCLGENYLFGYFSDAHDITDLQTKLVWCFVELIAQQATDED